MAAKSRAIIFVNGELRRPEAVRAMLQPGDFLVAADGGLTHLQRLGRQPALLVGDIDSLSQSEQIVLDKIGVEIHRHPPDKDETDLELALRLVLKRGFTVARIAAALGKRLDQTLGNIFLLLDPGLQGLDIRLDDGLEAVFVIRREAAITGKPGDTVSLLPLGGPAAGVTTAGLRYPLSAETLFPHKTRGISNVLLGQRAAVQIEKGMLLCIHRRQ